MTFVLEPVWPWSRLWEILLQLPSPIQAMAALAVIATLAIPPVAFARHRGLLLALVGTVTLALLFVVLQLGPFAFADAASVSGSGIVGFLAGCAWLVGLVLLLLAPFALAGLSVAAYIGTTSISRRKWLLIVGLRLLAFFLALVALARPALAWTQSDEVRSILYIVVDRSRSMTITDERAGRSRWEQTLRSLGEAKEAGMRRLRDDHQVEVRWFAFDTELREFDPEDPGKPEGQRTDFGTMLQRLFERRDGALHHRGLLIISDGADNGTNIPARAEASRWRSVPCLIHTFACGSPKTSQKQNDIAITTISTTPTPFVPVKGKLTVKVQIDARGFENSKHRVKLFMEGKDGKDVEVIARDVTLPLTTGNEVTLETDAPAKPGEVKLRVTIDAEDDFPLNNSIESFVTVSKEGISVLVVDRLRSGEPQAICDALAEDPRVRVTPLLLLGGKPLPGSNAARVFSQQEAPYDAIILGDVTLDMLRAADPNADERIAKLVGRGTGLIVLGGPTNLGNGGWQNSALEPVLPVDLAETGLIEGKVAMWPTEDGLRRMAYLFRMDEQADQMANWERHNRNKDAQLDGATKLRAKKRGTDLVLATTEKGGKGDPLLVMGQYSSGSSEKPGEAGVGRVLVFGGDTTHRWIRDERGKAFFSRYWRQVAVWLSKQEDAQGHVWVRPDSRRIPVRTDLGFLVGMRGKGGGPDIRDGKYEVDVITPSGQKIRTPITRGATENRGTFTATQQPGIYKIEVRGEGTDPSGGKISGTATARVIVYDEDVEMTQPAAGVEFLRNLAASGGGGEARRVEELPDFLNQLAEVPLEQTRAKRHYRPNWETERRTPSGALPGFLTTFFVVFCGVISLEWGLRRWWGLK